MTKMLRAAAVALMAIQVVGCSDAAAPAMHNPDGSVTVGGFTARVEKSDADIEAQLRLDRACSELAAQFWARSGYAHSDRVLAPYATHVNRAESRCLIDVVESRGDGGIIETVFDAGEGTKIGHASNRMGVRTIGRGRAAAVDETPALRAWFDGLMTQ
jgi:hypothetical protein